MVQSDQRNDLKSYHHTGNTFQLVGTYRTFRITVLLHCITVNHRKYEEKELEIIHKTDKPQYDIYKLNLCTKKDSALQNPFCIACVILYDVCNLQVSLRIFPEIICRNIPCYDILPNRQSLRYSCQSTQADVPHVPAGSAGHKRNR